MATWTSAFIDNLPDSSFAYIAPGGKKDSAGKTVPRSLRSLPYKDADGKVDLPHCRNALSRLPQADIPESKKAAIKAMLQKALDNADSMNSAAPTEDLIRMSPEVEVRSEPDGRRTLYGYAAVFNSPTEINSWEGHFIERIAPGAFKRTLQNNGDRIKVLFNHGMDPQIGDKPLGKPSVLREDAHGLYVEVPLDDTSYNRDLIASLDSGAIDGMSFRFSVPKGGDSWQMPAERGGLRERMVNEAKVRELGPVTWPAYSATMAGVRSKDQFASWRQDMGMMPMGDAESDSDEDPAALAEAVDAILDEMADCLAAGDTAQCQALLTGAETTIDSLIAALGGSDADDLASTGSAMPPRHAHPSDSEPHRATTRARIKTHAENRALLLNHGVARWLESTTSGRS